MAADWVRFGPAKLGGLQWHYWISFSQPWRDLCWCCGKNHIALCSQITCFIPFWSAGEYSASAIKSGSVSWSALIGCHGYLHWRNVSTLLTLLWIIKFALARDICQPNATSKATTRTSLLRAGDGATADVTRETGPKSGASFHRVSSSISATKVAEDKTWVVLRQSPSYLDLTH